jgi:hypothetical protein
VSVDNQEVVYARGRAGQGAEGREIIAIGDLLSMSGHGSPTLFRRDNALSIDKSDLLFLFDLSLSDYGLAIPRQGIERGGSGSAAAVAAAELCGHACVRARHLCGPGHERLRELHMLVGALVERAQMQGAESAWALDYHGCDRATDSPQGT